MIAILAASQNCPIKLPVKCVYLAEKYEPVNCSNGVSEGDSRGDVK
jgi:hypothetical protein